MARRNIFTIIQNLVAISSSPKGFPALMAPQKVFFFVLTVQGQDYLPHI